MNYDESFGNKERWDESQQSELEPHERLERPPPGKQTKVGRRYAETTRASRRALATPVQRKATADVTADEIREAAEHGLGGSAQALPYLDAIQQAFGDHDVTFIRAHVGGPATEAAARMKASAYATGDRVVFREHPDLHTAAHEAAHVIQQRTGVSLSDGVGQVGDHYETHADAVANAVVAGESAEPILDQLLGNSRGRATSGAIQRNPAPEEQPPALPSWEEVERILRQEIAQARRQGPDLGTDAPPAQTRESSEPSLPTRVQITPEVAVSVVPTVAQDAGSLQAAMENARRMRREWNELTGRRGDGPDEAAPLTMSEILRAPVSPDVGLRLTLEWRDAPAPPSTRVRPTIVQQWLDRLLGMATNAPSARSIAAAAREFRALSDDQRALILEGLSEQGLAERLANEDWFQRITQHREQTTTAPDSSRRTAVQRDARGRGEVELAHRAEIRTMVRLFQRSAPARQILAITSHWPSDTITAAWQIMRRQHAQFNVLGFVRNLTMAAMREFPREVHVLMQALDPAARSEILTGLCSGRDHREAMLAAFIMQGLPETDLAAWRQQDNGARLANMRAAMPPDTTELLQTAARSADGPLEPMEQERRQDAQREAVARGERTQAGESAEPAQQRRRSFRDLLRGIRTHLERGDMAAAFRGTGGENGGDCFVLSYNLDSSGAQLGALVRALEPNGLMDQWLDAVPREILFTQAENHISTTQWILRSRPPQAALDSAIRLVERGGSDNCRLAYEQIRAQPGPVQARFRTHDNGTTLRAMERQLPEGVVMTTAQLTTDRDESGRVRTRTGGFGTAATDEEQAQIEQAGDAARPGGATRLLAELRRHIERLRNGDDGAAIDTLTWVAGSSDAERRALVRRLDALGLVDQIIEQIGVNTLWTGGHRQDALLVLSARDPSRARAFLATLGESPSPEAALRGHMLLAALPAEARASLRSEHPAWLSAIQAHLPREILATGANYYGAEGSDRATLLEQLDSSALWTNEGDAAEEQLANVLRMAAAAGERPAIHQAAQRHGGFARHAQLLHSLGVHNTPEYEPTEPELDDTVDGPAMLATNDRIRWATTEDGAMGARGVPLDIYQDTDGHLSGVELRRQDRPQIPRATERHPGDPTYDQRSADRLEAQRRAELATERPNDLNFALDRRAGRLEAVIPQGLDIERINTSIGDLTIQTGAGRTGRITVNTTYRTEQAPTQRHELDIQVPSLTLHNIVLATPTRMVAIAELTIRELRFRTTELPFDPQALQEGSQQQELLSALRPDSIFSGPVLATALQRDSAVSDALAGLTTLDTTGPGNLHVHIAAVRAQGVTTSAGARADDVQLQDVVFDRANLPSHHARNLIRQLEHRIERQRQQLADLDPGDSAQTQRINRSITALETRVTALRALIERMGPGDEEYCELYRRHQAGDTLTPNEMTRLHELRAERAGLGGTSAHVLEVDAQGVGASTDGDAQGTVDIDGVFADGTGGSQSNPLAGALADPTALARATQGDLDAPLTDGRVSAERVRAENITPGVREVAADNVRVEANTDEEGGRATASADSIRITQHAQIDRARAELARLDTIPTQQRTPEQRARARELTLLLTEGAMAGYDVHHIRSQLDAARDQLATETGPQARRTRARIAELEQELATAEQAAGHLTDPQSITLTDASVGAQNLGDFASPGYTLSGREVTTTIHLGGGHASGMMFLVGDTRISSEGAELSELDANIVLRPVHNDDAWSVDFLRLSNLDWERVAVSGIRVRLTTEQGEQVEIHAPQATLQGLHARDIPLDTEPLAVAGQLELDALRADIQARIGDYLTATGSLHLNGVELRALTTGELELDINGGYGIDDFAIDVTNPPPGSLAARLRGVGASIRHLQSRELERSQDGEAAPHARVRLDRNSGELRFMTALRDTQVPRLTYNGGQRRFAARGGVSLTGVTVRGHAHVDTAEDSEQRVRGFVIDHMHLASIVGRQLHYRDGEQSLELERGTIEGVDLINYRPDDGTYTLDADHADLENVDYVTDTIWARVSAHGTDLRFEQLRDGRQLFRFEDLYGRAHLHYENEPPDIFSPETNADADVRFRNVNTGGEDIEITDETIDIPNLSLGHIELHNLNYDSPRFQLATIGHHVDRGIQMTGGRASVRVAYTGRGQARRIETITVREMTFPRVDMRGLELTLHGAHLRLQIPVHGTPARLNDFVMRQFTTTPDGSHITAEEIATGSAHIPEIRNAVSGQALARQLRVGNLSIGGLTVDGSNLDLNTIDADVVRATFEGSRNVTVTDVDIDGVQRRGEEVTVDTARSRIVFDDGNLRLEIPLELNEGLRQQPVNGRAEYTIPEADLSGTTFLVQNLRAYTEGEGDGPSGPWDVQGRRYLDTLAGTVGASVFVGPIEVPFRTLIQNGRINYEATEEASTTVWQDALVGFRRNGDMLELAAEPNALAALGLGGLAATDVAWVARWRGDEQDIDFGDHTIRVLTLMNPTLNPLIPESDGGPSLIRVENINAHLQLWGPRTIDLYNGTQIILGRERQEPLRIHATGSANEDGIDLDIQNVTIQSVRNLPVGGYILNTRPNGSVEVNNATVELTFWPDTLQPRRLSGTLINARARQLRITRDIFAE